MSEQVDPRPVRQDGSHDNGSVGVAVDAFRRLFLLHMAVQFWYVAIIESGKLRSVILNPLVAIGFNLCVLLAWFAPWRRIPIALLLASTAYYLWAVFPGGGNHFHLEFLFLLFLILFDTDEPNSQILLRQSIQWMVLVVLFFAGFQKLVHGYYFQGELLVIRTAFDRDFWLLKPLVQDHLQLSRDGIRAGAGPFRATGVLMHVFSNFVWASEIGAAFLLSNNKTRKIGILLTLVIVLGVFFTTREVLFGALLFNATLIFWSGPRPRFIFPCFFLVYGFVLFTGNG